MKIKKVLVFAFLFVFSINLFVGCRTKTPPATLKSYNGVELTYYKVFDGNDVFDPLINEYLIKHPGLKINYRKFSDFEEYQKTVINEMADGKGPDIFSMQNSWFTSNKGKITPMPADQGTPEDFSTVFVDTASKDLVLTDDEGKEQVYGLPMTVDTLALYYNKDHFQDRLPNPGKPAKTWEGIKTQIPALNKLNPDNPEEFEVAAMAMGLSTNIDRAVDILYLLFMQYGVIFYNNDISKSTFAGMQGKMDNYPAIAAMKFFSSFSDPQEKNYSWNENVISPDEAGKEVTAFALGKVSMIIGYSYTYDQIINEIGVLKSKGLKTIDKTAVKVAPIPQMYDPDASKEKRITYSNYFAETVSRNCKNPDVAWDFLVFLTSKDSLKYYFSKAHKVTSRRDMIEDQKKDPVYGQFASQIGYAESFPIVDYYKYKDLFSESITKAHNDDANKSELTQVQDLINEMLPKDGYLKPKKTLDAEEQAKEDKAKQDLKKNNGTTTNTDTTNN